ncbi:uncharacterized protein [Aegilops tauschii subsp. strangulata]|uniref:uncharacterized protein n=1 Tax=Aegilops tauschii subsp. strangulata TaxID=200361 RepID=UPI003CC8CAEE
MSLWWNEWQLRILVLASLSAQYFLVLSARARKFHIPPWLKVSLRLAHLGRDALAIFALATLFNRQKGGPRCSYARGTRDLELLWAPVLVMHLGGQVVITSYKIEDNEQWSRHILTSLSKVTVALCFQKALDLRDSSFNALRKASSLPEWVTLRRTKLRQKRLSRYNLNGEGLERKQEEGLIGKYVQDVKALVSRCVEPHLEQEASRAHPQLEADYPHLARPTVIPRLPYQLFLDFSSKYVHRLEIMRHFWSVDNEKVYLAIEGALSAMTSFLYTKDDSTTTLKKDDSTTRLDFKKTTVLLILRRYTHVLITCAALIAAICLVHTGSHKEDYSGEDTWVTLVLLYGTLLLELVYLCAKSAFREKFSGKILQHNLIGLVARNRCHSKLTRIAAWLGCKELVDEYFWHMKPNYSSCREITKLVRGHVQSGWEDYITDSGSYKKFNETRGDWTLARARCGYSERLDWSIRRPFDESVILWHLATDLLCAHLDTSPDDQCAPRCKEISNYMMHLLFENPEMLMPGSRKNLLARVCGELEDLLEREHTRRDKEITHRGISEFLIDFYHDTDHTEDNGIIVGACRLVAQILYNHNHGDSDDDQTRMWKVIQCVWVEMLCFSAGRSRGYLHAQTLGTGVEYLSYIWVLLAYTGMETLADKLQEREVFVDARV